VLKTCAELSLDEIEQEVDGHLRDRRVGGALDAIRDAVDTVINHPRSVARVYASFRLDRLCERVALAVPEIMPAPVSHTGQGGGTVIVATELAAAGGHVEVIKDLIRLGDIPQPIDLFLTNNFERIDASTQQGHAALIGVPLGIAAGQGSGERLDSTMAFLRERRPDTLVLLVHNQDATGIVAGLACGARKVVFVHHGDHHLSLGVTCPSMVHVDLSNFAFCNCRQALGLTNNVFWPLTLSSTKAHRHGGAFMAEGHAVTCCVGRPEKFDDPRYRYQYLDLLGPMLRATGGRHLHIGQLSAGQLERIGQSLASHGVDGSRFTHLPWVDSVSRALIEQGVDLYMTSFPYGGGKAQVEAMATGLPVLIHQNYRSRFLSGIDLGYPGVLTWRDDKELGRVLQALTPELLSSHGQAARAHFERHHSEAALRRAMRASATSEQDVPALAVVHEDGLQAFLEDEDLFKVAVLDGRESNEEIAHLRQILAHQEAEMRVLRKKARFLGGVRYKLTTMLKS
jgi:hypothetical protein